MYNSIGSPLHDEIELPVNEWRYGKDGRLEWSPQQMRQALTKVAYQYSPILQRLYRIADMQGLNGEDKYVFVAFHLQLEFENMQERLFTMINTSLKPPFILKP